MKILYLISLVMLVVFISCKQEETKPSKKTQFRLDTIPSIGLKYELYANHQFLFQISSNDIEFYDTTLLRGGLDMHSIRLKKNFLTQDTILVQYPLELLCKINGKRYFWATGLPISKAGVDPWLDFKLRLSCENTSRRPEEKTYPNKSPEIILVKTKECISIELICKKTYPECNKRKRYSYQKRI